MVEVTNGWMLYPPDQQQSPVLVHKTESDHRAIRNTISRMRGARVHLAAEEGNMT